MVFIKPILLGLREQSRNILALVANLYKLSKFVLDDSQQDLKKIDRSFYLPNEASWDEKKKTKLTALQFIKLI